MKQLIYVFIIGVLLAACAREQVESERPNFIFIMADDHANRAISAYDGSINHTPNIDRLAEEGALFHNSFCTNSICGPSRASILTGKHSHKNGITGNGAPWDGSQTLFPRVLKNKGYNTALIGKWHLNSLPGDAFNYSKVLTGAGKQGFYYNPEFCVNGKDTLTHQGYSTDIITDESLEWLEQNSGKEEPFMLFVQYKAPHVPRMPELRFMSRYIHDTIPEPGTLFDDFETRSHYATDVNFHIKNYRPRKKYGEYDPGENIYLKRMTEEQLKAYHSFIDPQNEEFQRMKEAGLLEGDKMKRYAYQRFIKDYIRVIDGVDENVGRILSWLDKHEKLKENTVVVYSSDQSYFTGEHGYAEKRLMYEEAMKMPFLIRYPKLIKPGSKPQALIQNIDYGPTFIDLAEIEIPEDMQGRSMKAVLAGNEPDDWRKSVYYHYYDHGRHKVGRHEGVRTHRYKLIHFYTDDVWEMYDLQNDPNEINNLYGNSDYSTEIDELKLELMKLQNQYEVPDWVFEPPYVSLKGIKVTKAGKQK